MWPTQRLTSDFLHPNFGSFVCFFWHSLVFSDPPRNYHLQISRRFASTSSVISTAQFLFPVSKLKYVFIHSWSWCLSQQASNSSLNSVLFIPMRYHCHYRSLMVAAPRRTKCTKASASCKQVKAPWLAPGQRHCSQTEAVWPVWVVWEFCFHF